MKVFLDSNVLIAAFLWKGGVCDEVLAVVYEEHTLLTGEVVLAETKERLAVRFQVPSEQITRFEAQLREDYIEPMPEAPEAYALPDPDDAWVLASAINAGAEILVTGDKPFFLGEAFKPRGQRRDQTSVFPVRRAHGDDPPCNEFARAEAGQAEEFFAGNQGFCGQGGRRVHDSADEGCIGHSVLW